MVNWKKKTHLVKWSTVCSSKNRGGLGILNISTFNKALQENGIGGLLWKKAQVILLKYRAEVGVWFSKCPRGSYGVRLKKEIRLEADHLQNNSAFRIGKDNKLKFWEAPWCSNLPLYVTFPTLYDGRSKNVKVEELSADCNMDFKFVRAFNNWKLEVAQKFLDLERQGPPLAVTSWYGIILLL